MGPRPFDRGNETERLAELQNLLLQWGRDLSIAETSNGDSSDIPIYASMGPRPFDRGNQSLPREDISRAVLQWGRDLSIAETPRDEPGQEDEARASMGPRPFDRGNQTEAVIASTGGAALQWGRDLSIAETCASATSTARTARFNGAATCRSRKHEEE
jgi:hypothetical protein